MRYKAIIFDLDGTLLDTLEDIANSVNRVLGKMGFPIHALDEYRYFVGDGALVLITRALPEDKRTEENIQNCINAFRSDYTQYWNIKTRPYEGIPQLLDSLKLCGLKMAVLSNKPHELTKKCVIELLPDWRFDAIFGQRESVPLKPDPAAALEVAGTLGVEPSKCLYLGDTAIDMKTAKGAGMFPVGVLWGFRPKEELLENGAQALIERPMDVLTLFDDFGSLSRY